MNPLCLDYELTCLEVPGGRLVISARPLALGQRTRLHMHARVLGNVQELIQRVPEVLRDAEERGDI